MKIGIITIHRSPSYGGSLQSFALFKYLEQQGYEVEIIDLLRPTHKDYRHSIYHFHSRDSIIKKMLSAIMSIFHIHYRKANAAKRYNNKFEEFNEKIKYSRTYRSVDELYRNPPIYDVYITGSDQVWNPLQPYMVEPYFLTFVKKGHGKKIAYAASVGLSTLRKKEQMLYKKWIEDYDYVSVREQVILSYFKAFVNKHIYRVADPTFLLERDYWKDIARFPLEPQPYILLFELVHNNELLAFCKRLSSQSGLNLVVLGQNEIKSGKEDYTIVNSAGPREFLGYIGNAEMVITDSFHGTVFSIIMEAKNFYTYISPINKKGSRITDLLQQHGISDHLLVPDLKQTWNELSKNNICRTGLDYYYHNEQNLSRTFLNNSLQ